MKYAVILIYTLFLIASYWHLYLCFQLLSPSIIAAHLLAVGFEIYLWITSYAYAYFLERSQYKEANQVEWMSKTGVFIVWLGNWVSLQRHFIDINLNFKPWGFDISEFLKWTIPGIVSLYIPIGTLGLGRLLGIVVQLKKISVEKWIQKNYSKYPNAYELKKAIENEFGVAINLKKLKKFYNA